MDANYSLDNASACFSNWFQELSTVSYKEQRSMELVSNFGAHGLFVAVTCWGLCI